MGYGQTVGAVDLISWGNGNSSAGNDGDGLPTLCACAKLGPQSNDSTQEVGHEWSGCDRRGVEA